MILTHRQRFILVDADKIRENHVEENESNNYVNGTLSTPKQFEAIKQQKEIWEQGIIM